MRDHARAGRELAHQFGAQLAVEPGREEQRHHAHAVQLDAEHVLIEERDALGHARAARVLARFHDEVGVDVDAKGAGRAAPQGFDHQPAVAAAEIRDHVRAANRSEIEHRAHDFHRRGLVAHVRRTKTSGGASPGEQGAGEEDFAKTSAFASRHG
jgi:hypothetical protein